MREIYQYNQQMGITLMGGFLSWLFILQAMLIGVLFLGSNYYFWLGITHRIPGSEVKYRKPIMTMLIILLLCLGVWMTPHSLVASLEEARKMGGTHHPLLGVFGVMSAKMTVANLMILVTFMKPETRMPTLGLSDPDAKAVTMYLATLRAPKPEKSVERAAN